VVNQFQRGRWVKWVKQYDAGSFIPVWTFFAPRPGTSDYEIVYRDKLGGSDVSPWQVIKRPPTSTLRGIWNPGKRYSKLITDCTLTHLTSFRPDEKAYVLDVSYMLLLLLVEKAPHDFRAEYTQFGIVAAEHVPEDRFAFAFVSEFVRLDSANQSDGVLL